MKHVMGVSAVVLSLSLVVGCTTSPVEHFYTLQPLPVPPKPQLLQNAPAEIFTVSVSPVGVPASADRHQWLVRTGATQMQILEQQRWIQPLSNDIAEAIALHLSQTHRFVTEVQTSESILSSGTIPLIGIRVTVVRFETLLAPVPGIHDEMKWIVNCGVDAKQNTTESRREGALTVSRQIPRTEGAENSEHMTSIYDRLAIEHANALAEASHSIAAAITEIKPLCFRR